MRRSAVCRSPPRSSRTHKDCRTGHRNPETHAAASASVRASSHQPTIRPATLIAERRLTSKSFNHNELIPMTPSSSHGLTLVQCRARSQRRKDVAFPESIHKEPAHDLALRQPAYRVTILMVVQHTLDEKRRDRLYRVRQHVQYLLHLLPTLLRADRAAAPAYRSRRSPDSGNTC